MGAKAKHGAQTVVDISKTMVKDVERNVYKAFELAMAKD